ncbi:hypothetical protein [Ralstonia mannitolilytica]|uniref:hypothetical protein n=1 Tax=Ralstonia mannitolilytica TaxID=105219 RepID=UPI0028F57238|nr:hypothetical protein [Ralstonia mannitolilytica]CAJ0716427.1 hypothetical protein LMG8323_03240 [Ralstonia mannitolilytica]
MTNLLNLHREAMKEADEGLYARSIGDELSFMRHTRRALELEESAAVQFATSVSPAQEPTRTILLRSAATLALRCNEVAKAEKLAAMALAGDGPEALKDEVRDLLEEVQFERHLAERGVTLGEGELQMSLSGAGVSFGMIPAAQYLERARVMGNLLRRTGERIFHLPFQRHRGRSPELFPVFLSVPRPASFAVTFRLGGTQGVIHGLHSADTVLDRFMDDIELLNSDEIVSLREQMGDVDYFQNFLASLRHIAPDGKSIQQLGFTARSGGRVRKVALRKPRSAMTFGPALSREDEVVEGVLVAADRGRNAVRVGDIRIRVPDGLIDDIVRPLWGQRVRATVQRRRGSNGRTLVDIQGEDLLEGEESRT